MCSSDLEEQAKAAIDGLHEQEHEGRRLTVNEAKPREDRGGGGYGGDRPADRGSGARGWEDRSYGGGENFEAGRSRRRRGGGGDQGGYGGAEG